MEEEYKIFKLILLEYLREIFLQRKLIATHQPFLNFKNKTATLRWYSKKKYKFKQQKNKKINCTTFTLIFFNIHLLLAQYKVTTYLTWYFSIKNDLLSCYYFHQHTQSLWMDLKLYIKKNDNDLYTQLPDCFFYSIEATPAYVFFLIRYIIEETLMFYHRFKQNNLREFIFFTQIIKNTMTLYNNSKRI